MHHYRPQRSWGKVIFSQASVILLTGGGLVPGGCGVWSGGVRSRGMSAPGGVPGGDPPGRLLLQAVRTLLECILVAFIKFTKFNDCTS